MARLLGHDRRAETVTATVAAFDLDGTLTDRDCLIPFVTALVGRRTLASALAKHIIRKPASVRDRDQLKAVTALTLSGVEHEVATMRAEAFITDHVMGWLRSDTLARLNQHQSAGHHVVIVSASFEIYVSRLAERLGVDYLATRLDVDDGRLTGRLLGPNCRGDEKVTRLTEYVRQRLDADLDDVELYAYGDSAGDRPLLDIADHACFVRRVDRWSPV